MTKKYKILDVVTATKEFGNRTFALVENTLTGYIAVSLKGHKRYPITDEQIEEVVGRLDENSPLLVSDEDSYDIDAGVRFCHAQANGFPTEAPKWRFLAKLVPGDSIRMVHRKMIYPAEFVRLNLRRPLYPIRAKIKGMAHDFTLDSLLIPKSDLQPPKNGV